MGMDICLLANEIDGIFALSCALCADHIIFPEVIHTLAACMSACDLIPED